MYLGEQTCEITIADKYILKGLHHCEIKKSVHQAIQTAKLELPLSVVVRNNDMSQRIKLTDKINEGDTITIAFGYNGNNNIEFTGFIKRINYAMPLMLECEDELYLLRKLNLKKSFGKCTLKDVLTYLLDETNKVQNIDWVLYDNIPEFVFRKYIIGASQLTATGADIITDLTNNYPFSIRLITLNGKKTLFAGLTYALNGNDVNYVFNKNTITTSELKYNSSTQQKTYKVTAINYRLDGTKITYEIGDKNGQQITIRPIGNYTEKEINVMAVHEIQKMSGNGYKGNFECFLSPFIQPCDICNITDPQFSERGGRHYTGTVTTTFGVDGGRRKPEVDFKL